MTTTRDAIRAQLTALVEEGNHLYMREQVHQLSPSEREALAAKFADEKPAPGAAKKPRKSAPPATELEPMVAALFRKPEFMREYNAWYSKGLPVMRQLLPERYDEFVGLYRSDRRGKPLDVTTCGIADYLAGIQVTRGYLSEPGFDSTSVALGKFKQQVEMLRSGC